MALRTERQSAGMLKIKNCGLDQYGAEPFKQQQFGTAGVEGVNAQSHYVINNLPPVCIKCRAAHDCPQDTS